MNIDYSQSMAFVASVGEGDSEEVVGVGRYGKTEAAGTVELGITVSDRWQRHGIARELIEQVACYAASQGFRALIGWVLYENQPMLALARTCGFRVRIAPENRSMEIIRELADTAVEPG